MAAASEGQLVGSMIRALDLYQHNPGFDFQTGCRNFFSYALYCCDIHVVRVGLMTPWEGNVTVDLSCLVCIAFRLNLILRESFAQKLEHGAYTDMTRVRFPASEGKKTFSTLLYVCTGFHVVRQYIYSSRLYCPVRCRNLFYNGLAISAYIAGLTLKITTLSSATSFRTD